MLLFGPWRAPVSQAAVLADRRVQVSKGGKRRTMSAAARKRISEMMKLRWAERKKKAKAKA